MPLNVPGILAPLQFLLNPRIIVPGLSVKDIRHLNFNALKKAGYRGIVFDKDNCLANTLVPELEEAWKECRQTFGPKNVLVVSNSAGSKRDAGGIQAKSVRHHLGVPVLFHASMKPGYSCIKQIRSYFRSLSDPVNDDQLIVVGDRLFTDIVMANRFPLPPHRTLGVWTTSVWVREATLMRFCERKLLDGVKKWIIARSKARASKLAAQAKEDDVNDKFSGKDEVKRKTVGDQSQEEITEGEEAVLRRAFVHPLPPALPPSRKNGALRTLVNLVKSATVLLRRS
ncbi:hypothetical protein GYMLUDRAFT_166904 [Collybiopsis luxurians FD-317 M1]|uniref:Phosphatidylglycerophosphatase n=1 Tax=Collybiopsis luxurians FD-317 M1 TaxID=944289 RepID=A0A0D0BBY9_9AGAR|nr:hypothetical protein GYMLUDRAFT_166904 [Collybiopsis luxurians FD-317 M1]